MDQGPPQQVSPRKVAGTHVADVEQVGRESIRHSLRLNPRPNATFLLITAFVNCGGGHFVQEGRAEIIARIIVDLRQVYTRS